MPEPKLCHVRSGGHERLHHVGTAGATSATCAKAACCMRSPAYTSYSRLIQVFEPLPSNHGFVSSLGAPLWRVKCRVQVNQRERDMPQQELLSVGCNPLSGRSMIRTRHRCTASIRNRTCVPLPDAVHPHTFVKLCDGIWLQPKLFAAATVLCHVLWVPSMACQTSEA